jgi:hypothetical protein
VTTSSPQPPNTTTLATKTYPIIKIIPITLTPEEAAALGGGHL